MYFHDVKNFIIHLKLRGNYFFYAYLQLISRLT